MGWDCQRLAATELTARHRAAWSEIRATDPLLASPHFTVELLQQVAAVRPGVEVAVLLRNGEPSGFLPYQRGRGGRAEPYAGTLSDLQAMIVRPDEDFDPRLLLRGCNLSRFHFSELMAHQQAFAPFHAVTGEAPYIDISQGFETYRQQRRAAGTDEVQQALRKMRKLEREVGLLRFEPHCSDPLILERLIAWKAEQMAARRMPNALAAPWQQQLLRRLLDVREEPLRGILSALFLGDRLVAGMMGVFAFGVLNGWVTAYDAEFSRYSPGLLLHVQLAQSAADLGIHRIDMGRGSEMYKQSFRSGSIAVAEGCIGRRFLSTALHGACLRAREWVRGSPLGDSARQWWHRWRCAAGPRKTAT
jgi:CelD/BcsL family acetyltransferase involved in cellulose biosynthesis